MAQRDCPALRSGRRENHRRNQDCTPPQIPIRPFFKSQTPLPDGERTRPRVQFSAPPRKTRVTRNRAESLRPRSAPRGWMRGRSQRPARERVLPPCQRPPIHSRLPHPHTSPRERPGARLCAEHQPQHVRRPDVSPPFRHAQRLPLLRLVCDTAALPSRRDRPRLVPPATASCKEFSRPLCLPPCPRLPSR